MGDHDLHRAIGAHGRRLDDLLARVTALEFRAAQVPEERILAATALVLTERRLALEELAEDLDCAVLPNRVAEHMAAIQHAVAEGVRRGIKLAKGEA